MKTPVIPIDFSITHVKWGEKTHKARKLVIDMVLGHDTCITEKEKTHKTRKLVTGIVLGHNTSIKEKGKTTKTTITSTDVPLMDIL